MGLFNSKKPNYPDKKMNDLVDSRTKGMELEPGELTPGELELLTSKPYANRAELMADITKLEPDEMRTIAKRQTKEMEDAQSKTK